MRAVTCRDHRLRFDAAYADPHAGDGECVVRVHLAGICATDHQLVHGYMRFEGVLGHEMVGTVVSGSPGWKDKRVVSEINCVCGTCSECVGGLANHCRSRAVLGIDGRDGCFADLVAVPEGNLHEVPADISDEEAVFVEPLAAAFQVIKQVRVEPKMRVTVVGSGRLGLLIAQVLAARRCGLQVVGRNPKTLLICEKRRIQPVHVDELVARQDQDVVVECTGSADGLRLAMELVRPRGTIVLKSTYAAEEAVNLSRLVVNEVQTIGSRCGPFPDAIQALSRQEVDVSSMVSRTLPIERVSEAFEASASPDNVKVLLRVNPR